MKIIIKSTGLESSDALQAYIQEVLMPLDKFVQSFEKEGDVVFNVEVARTTRHHKKGGVYYVEITGKIHKETIRIEQYGDDLHAAIDQARDRLKVDLRRYKDKIQNKRRS